MALATHFLKGLVALIGWLLRRVAAAGASVAKEIARADRGSQLVVSVVVTIIVVAYLDYRSLDTGGPAISTDQNIEALARVIRSEVGGSPPIHRTHVAWATRNLARERGQSIAEMACSPCGRQQRGRPVSSRMAARDRDRAVAKHVLAQPDSLDPTGGATHFINPRVQDKLAKSGRVRGYKGRTYKSVRMRWKKRYGWEPYYRLGPDLEMWGNKRPPRER